MKLGAIKEPGILGERAGEGNKSEICQRFIPAVRILARRKETGGCDGGGETLGKGGREREERRILHWEKNVRVVHGLYTVYTAMRRSMHTNNSVVACAT